MYFAAFRWTQAFNGNGLAHPLRVRPGVVQHDDASQRVADQADGKVVDDVQQRGKIEDVLDQAVHRSRRPGAVSVAAQINGVDVIVLAQLARDPVPIARMVQASMDQHKRRLAVLAVIPKLKLQTIGIEEMGDWFHGVRGKSLEIESEIRVTLS